MSSSVPSSPSTASAAHGVGVVVVDDSPVQRRFLRAMIESDPELTVIGEARTGREAVQLVERLRPAVVLMDLDLPVMNGIEAIERIMATQPTPILVYSAFVDGPDNKNGLAAIAAGAVDIVPKPGPSDSDGLDAYAEALRRRLRVASRVRVITHPRARLRGTATRVPEGEASTAGESTPASSPASSPQSPSAGSPRIAAATTKAPAKGAAPAAGAAVLSPAPGTTATARAASARQERDRAPVRPPRSPRADARDRAFDLIAIGVSTGGPQALATLLGALPADLEQAVVVVQHMADGFLEGLAAWLDSQCALPVRLGEEGKRLQPGTVTVAPGGLNLLVHERLRTSYEAPPPSQFHIPGIDPTFSSIAASMASSSIGVILTGMGRDGAAGLKAMRDRGAVTIGQDEASCAVYGMPGAAMALGAVEHELPLCDIAPLLLDLVDGRAVRSAGGTP